MDIFEEVEKFYKGVRTKKRIIGKSVFGRSIYAVRLGEGTPVGIAQYAIHGREWITAKLALEQFRFGPGAGSVWIVPLMNPDGALLSQCGLSSVADGAARERLLRINGGEDFSLWKANGAGVDLNVNFDADWGEGKRNVRAAASENYIGPAPFSEPETRALKALRRKSVPIIRSAIIQRAGRYIGIIISRCRRAYAIKSWRLRFRSFPAIVPPVVRISIFGRAMAWCSFLL